MNIEQYDIIKLAEDLNQNLQKGMLGTVLEKFSDNEFEIEVVDAQGDTVCFENHFTFTVRKDQIIKFSHE